MTTNTRTNMVMLSIVREYLTTVYLCMAVSSIYLVKQSTSSSVNFEKSNAFLFAMQLLTLGHE